MEGYTPHYLCSTANIGQAILYARPLQRDIDLETISQTEEPGPQTQCEVECMFCGQAINMASIQDHIDVCEISHQPSTSAAQTSAQSSAAQTSAQSSAAQTSAQSSAAQSSAQSAAPTSAAQSSAQSSASTSAAQSSAPTSAAQSSAQSSASTSAAQSSAPTSAAQSSAQSSASTSAAQSAAPTSAAQSSAQSSASTSAAQSAAQSSASTSAAQSSASTSAAQSSASTSAAQTSAAYTSSTGRVSEICNEEWKLEPDTKAAAKIPILIGPVLLMSKGDCAIGDGVKKYLFSLCLNKLQTGLHLHLDYTDLDIVEIVSLLESQTVLTPENVDQVNHLALSWDLPNLTENNRRLLAQQILHHGVIVRRERQMVQLRKGLKDTRVLEMLKERPELASALFPRSAEAELEPEMIIERIVWPEPDSDEEEAIDDYCSVVAYLRQYISLASSSELQQLIEFWTGWAVLPDELYVSVDRDATYPTASTCFTTLKIPTGCGSYRDFCFKLGAAVSTTKFGFGRI
ncbi:unnamed protein product [Arctogadus glacialis]